MVRFLSSPANDYRSNDSKVMNSATSIVIYSNHLELEHRIIHIKIKYISKHHYPFDDLI